MKVHNVINRFTLLSALLCLGAINSSPASAAQVALSDTPLFLTTSAEANIFYLYDDSKSMQSEAITPDAVSKYVGSEIHDNSGSYQFEFGTGVDNTGSTVTIHGSNVAPYTLTKGRAPEYNSLYYDPNITYKPWPLIPGDSNTTISNLVNPTNSNQMKEYPPTAAPLDPMHPSVTVDLTSDQWPQPGGASTDKYMPMIYYNWNGTSTSGPYTVPSSQYQNFSNWFTYHRTREYAAKYALATSIHNTPLGTRLRMGFSTINDQDKLKMASVTSQVADAATDTGAQNRAKIIDAVYGLSSSGTTPLRSAFQKASNYFACDGNANPWDSNTSTCALQKNLLSPTDSEPPAACQQNFIVVMTDGVDDASYTAETGRSNADNLTVPSSPANAADLPPYVFDKTPYQSSTENGMADLAMYYYANDLDTNIDNKVPTECGVDENSAQHLVTYAMSFGLSPSATAPSAHPQLNIAPDYCAPTTVAAPTWNDDFSTATSTSDILYSKTNDLLHAAYNGRGKYYSAEQPTQMVNDLQDVLGDIASRRGAASTVGFSSTSNEAGTLAYFSSFKSGAWYGELRAYAFDSTGNLITTPTWDAGNILDALTNSDVTGTGRTIITSSRSDDATDGYGRPFRWSDLSNAQQLDLRTAKDGTTETTSGFPIANERLNYIRGDHSCEAGTSTVNSCNFSAGFRPRLKGTNTYTRLGDLINSSPIYVGQSIGNYPSAAPFPSASGETYQDFKDGTATNAAFSTTTINTTNRTPMIYIGGNDGMLHVFRADATTNGGKEIFSFIPSALSPISPSTTSGLHNLTENSGHHSYVDLTPSIADAYTATPTDTTRKWRTVLVDGLRSGGQGVFALDVTDPDSVINAAPIAKEDVASKKVMWEFTNQDDPDLGYTYSEPVIVPLRVGSANTTSDIAWFAVFGNGYNNAGSGHAVLFLLKLSGPTGGTPSNRQWILGTDYYKIDTGVGTTLTPNGLSSPAVIDNNGDGIYDRVYAGDMQGNMWAFDLDKTTPADWASAYDNGGSPATPKPLFTAESLTGSVQPITSKPLIIRNKAGGSSSFPNVLVLFGTGSYIAVGDQTNTDGQSYYAVWDHGSQELTRTDLVTKHLLNNSSTDYRVIDPAASDVPNYTATPPDNGWYLDLPDSGERVISNSVLVGSNVFFSSIVPSTSPCSGGGTSWLTAVDPLTGQSPGITTFDYNHDGVIDSADVPTLASDNNTQVAGIKITSMIPQYSFLVSSNASPGSGPCANGTAVLGIGTTTQAGTQTNTLCTGSSAAKAGRYSWRQLNF